jgi:hypothetical protein
MKDFEKHTEDTHPYGRTKNKEEPFHLGWIMTRTRIRTRRLIMVITLPLITENSSLTSMTTLNDGECS